MKTKAILVQKVCESHEGVFVYDATSQPSCPVCYDEAHLTKANKELEKETRDLHATVIALERQLLDSDVRVPALKGAARRGLLAAVAGRKFRKDS